MINKVIQFNESHKWCGCLGVVTEARSDIDRYMIAVSIPEKGIAYIFAKLENLEVIGEAVLIPSPTEEDLMPQPYEESESE